LLLFDALKMQFRELKLKKNADCAICGTHPTINHLIDYDSFCGVPVQTTISENSTMTVQELKSRFDNDDKPFLLDVRQPNEFNLVNLGGRLIPLGELPRRVHELDASKEIVVYCHHGMRSAQALAFLRQSGFGNVKNLSGGIDAWAREVEPMMVRY
jgi:adenylyltransferase/sulfurtransferase